MVNSSQMLYTACFKEYSKLANLVREDAVEDTSHLQEKMQTITDVAKCITLHSTLCTAYSSKISSCHTLVHNTRHEFEKQATISQLDDCMNTVQACLALTTSVQQQATAYLDKKKNS